MSGRETGPRVIRFGLGGFTKSLLAVYSLVAVGCLILILTDATVLGWPHFEVLYDRRATGYAGLFMVVTAAYFELQWGTVTSEGVQVNRLLSRRFYTALGLNPFVVARQAGGVSVPALRRIGRRQILLLALRANRRQKVEEWVEEANELLGLGGR